MRKLLPRNEYKLLKNRKCARLSRTRRKEQTQTIININKRLKEENALLRQQLGLPPEEEKTISLNSSDLDNDSAGEDDTI